MPHDPARVADTAAWLRKAEEDLAIAKELLKPPKTLCGGAVFHCQQAAEKALKITFSASCQGRILVVVYTIRGDRIRIISARKATRQERSQYESKH